MLIQWITLIGATFAALLPIVNPFSTAPVFVAVTRRMPPEMRTQQARLACIYMAIMLTVTLVAGILILNFFGISLPALRVAGGLIVARIGFGMLSPDPDAELSEEGKAAAMDSESVAFTPIAMPMLSGPGSIAVTIGMATEAEVFSHSLAIAVGIVLVAFVSWLVLRSSLRVVDFLGVTGVTVLTRIMGLLLVCIGVQFVFRGLIEGVTDPEVMAAIIAAIAAAGGG